MVSDRTPLSLTSSADRRLTSGMKELERTELRQWEFSVWRKLINSVPQSRDFPNPTAEGPEKLNPTLMLFLLWAGGWMRDHQRFFPKLFPVVALERIWPDLCRELVAQNQSRLETALAYQPAVLLVRRSSFRQIQEGSSSTRYSAIRNLVHKAYRSLTGSCASFHLNEIGIISKDNANMEQIQDDMQCREFQESIQRAVQSKRTNGHAKYRWEGKTKVIIWLEAEPYRSKQGFLYKGKQ